MGILRRILAIISCAAKAAFFCIGISLLSIIFAVQPVYTEAVPQEVYASTSPFERRAFKEELISADLKEIYSVANISTAKVSANVSVPVINGNNLRIPAIAVNSSAYSVGINSLGEIAVPDSGVGLWNGGAMPGHSGNVFLNGHVFSVFSDLKNLVPGATIELAWQGTVYRYQVISNDTYSMTNLLANNYATWRNILYFAPNGHNLTIMTCAGYPVGGTYSHRTVVRAVQI